MHSISSATLNVPSAGEIDMVNNSPSAESTSIGSDSTTHHKCLWFDDGSIVLIVEQTSFRVHRSVLCVQSEIFADMFKVPQPKGEITIEGCDVVRLPDKAADVADLLKACYEPLYFDRIRPDADIGTILGFISGILRLSTKYYIQSLRNKCIDILKRKIPTSSLAEMDSIFGPGTHTARVRYAEFSAGIRFSIVNLARETNIPEFLPFAFYLCACLSVDVAVNGTSTTMLSWKDKAICLAGRAFLLAIQRTVIFSPSIGIKQSASCKKRPTLCVSKIPMEIIQAERERETSSMLTMLEIEPPTITTLAHYVCAACVGQVESWRQAGRREVWKRLPEVFRMGSWQHLQSAE